MDSASMQNRGFSPSWLRILVVVLLMLGLFFRFANLDRKVYWHDETITSMQASGYTGAEVRQDVFDGNVIGVEALQKYQRPNPEKIPLEVINSFAAHDPLHTPFYYTALRFWMQGFGSSVTAIRSFSAVVSVLALICMYWLCWELFESPLIGWMGVVLLAVSPFQVLYAQEAREYSLLAVETLLSSAALLRALRLGRKRSWGLYSMTLVLGIYSHLFFSLVAIGHGLYAIALNGLKGYKTIVAYLLASLAGLVCFVPWIWVILTHLPKAQKSISWTRRATDEFSFIVKWWTRNLAHVFVDLDPAYDFKDALGRDDPFLIPLVLLLVGYALYFLCRHTPKRVWLFLLTLIGVTALALMLPDVIAGGRRSLVARYWTPSYLGIQIAVAYLLATQLSTISVPVWRQRFWQGVVVVLISGGVASCAISSQANAWWNKHINYYFPQAAAIVNQAEQPLVVSDDNRVANALALSYVLAPQTKLLLGPQLDPARFLTEEPEFSDIFLLNCSPRLRDRIQSSNRYTLKPLANNYGLDLRQLVEQTP